MVVLTFSGLASNLLLRIDNFSTQVPEITAALSLYAEINPFGDELLVFLIKSNNEFSCSIPSINHLVLKIL